MICDSEQNSADTDASVHENLGMMKIIRNLSFTKVAKADN